MEEKIIEALLKAVANNPELIERAIVAGVQLLVNKLEGAVAAAKPG